MSPHRSRIIFIALIGSCAALLLLVVIRPAPAAQVDTTFADLQQAFASRNAADVVATTHTDYDFKALWPFLDGFMTLSYTQGDTEQQLAYRRQLQRQLATYFLYSARSQTQHQLDYTVHEVSELPNGDYQAVVTFGLKASKGRLPKSINPPISKHSFVLRSAGWLWPSTTILSHDPIKL